MVLLKDASRFTSNPLYFVNSVGGRASSSLSFSKGLNIKWRIVSLKGAKMVLSVRTRCL